MDENVILKEKANYIVKIRRGGKVSHVWEFEDAIIKYNDALKGWEIFTNLNASVFINGEVEIWRINQKPVKPVPPPKKEQTMIKFPSMKKPPEPPPPPATVREIYEKIYKKVDIKSLLFPDKSEIEAQA